MYVFLVVTYIIICSMLTIKIGIHGGYLLCCWLDMDYKYHTLVRLGCVTDFKVFRVVDGAYLLTFPFPIYDMLTCLFNLKNSSQNAFFFEKELQDENFG